MRRRMRAQREQGELNLVVVGGLIAVLVGGFALVRTQTFVGDEAFLRSMIPHHSRAVLVCEESALTDPEIIELCQSIIDSQTREINQMKEILERY